MIFRKLSTRSPIHFSFHPSPTQHYNTTQCAGYPPTSVGGWPVADTPTPHLPTDTSAQESRKAPAYPPSFLIFMFPHTPTHPTSPLPHTPTISLPPHPALSFPPPPLPCPPTQLKSLSGRPGVVSQFQPPSPPSPSSHPILTSPTLIPPSPSITPRSP